MAVRHQTSLGREGFAKIARERLLWNRDLTDPQCDTKQPEVERGHGTVWKLNRASLDPLSEQPISPQ